MTRSLSKSRGILVEAKYRNKLERSVGSQLDSTGVPFGYETLKLTYTIPERVAKYTPDFIIGPHKVTARGSKVDLRGLMVIEAKGYFYDTSERQKLAYIKEQHPEIDLRIVFQNANKPIYKGSPTTYGKWASDHGIPWADKGVIPEAWLKEISKKCRQAD